MRFIYLTIIIISAILATPLSCAAYIGPGAGFALVSSFFVLIVAALLAFFTVLTLPVRTIYLFFRRRKINKHMKARRVVVMGFDGMDPVLCRKFMADGKLPNLKSLSKSGTFAELATTTPSISPVAWSTFATGVNPGKHRIFDFFTRDPRNYLPVLSSALISTGKNGKKATVKLLRKSTSFWKILGKSKIFSIILRVPITFPAEKFYGTCLSAMCAPDLRGSQGSFTLFTSEPEDTRPSKGEIVSIDLQSNRLSLTIPGPQFVNDNKKETLSIQVTGTIEKQNKTVRLNLPHETIVLKQGEYSSWQPLKFKIGIRKEIAGIGRFLVTEITPHLKIYLTPINIDPEHPSMPISSPSYYSICLAKLHGPFATLGLAEDTWALNEEIIDEKAFLTQAHDICTERETAFLDNLQKSNEGLLVKVFDTTDRIQHMFFRYQDQDHPANQGKDISRHKDAILEIYQRSDQLVGKVIEQLHKDDFLLVISDHGFKPFKWGVNLNTWLWQEGYLVLKENSQPGAEWFADVDWQKTRAFAFGLAGIFINTKGREKQGIVKPGKEKQALVLELKEKLEAMEDDDRPQKPINRAILATEELSGPYVKEAPDIFTGFNIGYRVSWNSAIGRITEQVIEPNTKHWSGDHCLDPKLVPGVVFSNWQLQDADPALMDLGPTILDIFGLPKERFHDGKILNFQKT